MKSVLFALLLSLGGSWAQRQIAYIYDLPNQNHLGAWSGRTESCSDFRYCDTYIKDNVVSSTRVTGIWIFYSEYFYNNQNEGRVEWVYGDGYMHNLKIVNNQVSSLRFVGNQNNWKADSITLFQFDIFLGLGYYDWTDNTQVPSGMSAVGSLIITGQNYWTVYTSTNFSGNRACIRVQPGQYVGFAQNLDDYGIFTVRSYRRGCYVDKKITLNSDQHGFAVTAQE